MNSVSKLRVGSVFGTVLALWHLSWALLVALGLAQPLMNLIFRLHFIDPPYQVAPFRIDYALALIGITLTLGFLCGWAVAALWNILHRINGTVRHKFVRATATGVSGLD